MTQAQLVERFIAALLANPHATPPFGLDPALAEAIRRTVLAERAGAAPAGIRVRVWERVQRAVDADRVPIVAGPRSSPNGQQSNDRRQFVTREEDREIVVITQRQTRNLPLGAGRLTALAAMLVVIIFGGVLLVNLAYGRGPSELVGEIDYSLEEANTAVFERYINEAWNQGVTDMLNEVMTADVTCHESGTDELHGSDAVAALIDAYRAAFPDLVITIDSMGASENEVWARLTISGMQTGNLVLADGMVIPASDSVVAVSEMQIARFAGGKIAEVWVEQDSFGLMTQIEAVPTIRETVIETHNLQSAMVANALWAQEEPVEMARMSALYHDRVVVYGPTGSDPAIMDPSTRTVQDVRDLINDHHTHYTVQEHTVLDAVVDGDTVVVHYQVSHTQTSADLTWAESTMSSIDETETYEGVTIYHFEDGRIAEEWWYLDYARYIRTELCK